ncbi:MAG: putative acyl carrier [Frankiales bacterium]|nr:putative acyl carrier [Frankiales bacterium]
MAEKTTRDVVLEVLHEVFTEFADIDVVPDLTDDLVLLESGLDSLAFAVVVTELDDRLGIDPFTQSEDPVYPTTVGEFVTIYEQAVATAA